MQRHFDANPLTVRVDDSQVGRALNNIQKLKRESKQIQVSSPSPSTRPSTISASSSEVNVKPIVAAIQQLPEQLELDKHFKSLEQSIEDNSAKRGILGTMISGFNERVGGATANILPRQLKRQFNIDVDNPKFVDDLSDKLAVPIKVYITENEKLKPALDQIETVLQTRLRKAAYSMGDAIVAGLEAESKQVQTVFKQMFRLSDLKQGFNDIKGDAKAIAKELDHAFGGVEKVAPVFKTMAQGLSRYRRAAVEERAVPLVQQRASEILQSRRRKSGGVETANIVSQDTKELVITTGGYGAARGLSGVRIARDLKKELPEGSAVIAVRNLDTDIKVTTTNAAKLREILRSLSKPNLRGYSKDAVEIAAQAFAAYERNPEIKIKILGESGGGFPAEEAAEILKMIGIKNVEFLAVGTPELAGNVGTQKGRKIISPDESLGSEAHRVYAPMGLADVSSPEQQILGVMEHPFEGYRDAKVAELQTFLHGPPAPLAKDEVQQIAGAAKVFSETKFDELDEKQLKTLSRQAFANLQLIRAQLKVATDETRSELEAIVQVFEQVFVRATGDPADIGQVRQVLSQAQGIFAKLHEVGVVEARQVAQQMASELKAYQSELRERHGKSVGTLGAKFKQVDKELTDTIAELTQPVDKLMAQFKQRTQPTPVIQESVAAPEPTLNIESVRDLYKERINDLGAIFRQKGKEFASEGGPTSKAQSLASEINANAEAARREIDNLVALLGDNMTDELRQVAKTARKRITESRKQVSSRTWQPTEAGQAPAADTGAEVASGLSEGIAQRIAAARQAGEMLGRAVTRGAEDELDISSPSRVFKRIGRYAVEGLESGIRGGLDAARQAGQALGDATTQTAESTLSRLGPSAEQAAEPVKTRLGGAFGRLGSIVKDVATSALALVGAFTIGDLIVELGRQAFGTALEFERLEIALDFSTGGKGAETLGRIGQEADRLGVSLRESAKGYQQFNAATMGTSLEGQTEQIFGGFQQASAARALSPQQTESVFRAVSQIASKGRVSLEEMNQQLGEALPGALQAAARALGLTTPELIALIESGNVLAEDLLPKMSQQMRLESIGVMAEAADTMQAKLNRFNNALTKSGMIMGEFSLDAVKPGVEVATSALQLLNDNANTVIAVIRSLSTFLGVALVMSLGRIAKALGLGTALMKMFGIAGLNAQGAMLKLGSGMLSLGRSLAVFAAITAGIELVSRAMNQGSDEIKDANKGISDSLDRLIDKERQLAEEARKRGEAQKGPGAEPEPRATNDWLNKADQLVMKPLKPLWQLNEWITSRHPLLKDISVFGKSAEGGATFAERERNIEIKRVQDSVTKNREYLGKVPALTPEASTQAIADIKQIDLEIQKVQGRQGILKLEGQTQEVQKLQQELDKLGKDRQGVLDRVFGNQAELQGQRDNLEKTRKELEAMRANPNDAVGVENADKQLSGVNAQIAETDKRLNAMKAVADATATAMTNLADKFNKVNAAAENAKFRSGLQLANNMTALYNSQAQGNVSEAKAQDLTRTVEIQGNDQQINQLQQDAQARQDIIKQMSEGERVKLETYLGKPIGQAGPGDISLAKERVKLLKEELTGNQEAALAAQESILQGQQETAQLQQQTAQIKAQIAEQKRQEQIQKALIGVRRIAAAQARDQFNAELQATQAQTQIYQLQAQGQVSEAQAQHLLVQAEQQSLQQRITQFQQYAQQRQAIVDQLSAHERDALERYLGTSLSSAGAEDIANAREQAQLDKVNLSPQQEKALAAQEQLKESQTQIAQAEQQLAQSQAQAKERQRQLDQQIKEYYEQVAKTAKDMQRQLEEATLNATQVARDALLEVREIKSSTAFTRLKTRITRAMLGNTDDFMESFASSFEEYMSLTFEREQLSVDQLRNKYAIQDQIKDLKQSLADVMDSIRQTLIDMRKQLEELKRQIPTTDGTSTAASSGTAGGNGIMFPIAGKSATQNLTPGQGMSASRNGGRRRHNAQDYAYATGTPVVAPFNGTVARIDWDKGESQVILRGVNAQGRRVEAAMTHLSQTAVRAGQSVMMGQRIGAVGGGRGSFGSSGAHFHLGIKVNGQPVDPRTFFSGASLNVNAKGGGSVAGLSATQMGHARTIIQVGQQRGASRRDILAALSTGLVETGLRNLNRGHLDSKGVFQQRPSQGWTNVTNVAHAAGAFYDTARSMGQGRNISAGELAARVQRPAAKYRGRYTQRMPEAQSILAALTGDASGGEAVESAHDKWMRIGYAAYRSGDLNTALINFKRAAREDPSTAAYTAMNNTAKALQAQRRKRETPYDKAMRVGYEAVQSGDANTALINFQRAVKIRPTIKAQQARNNMRQALAAGGIKTRPKGGRAGLDGSLEGLEGIAARGIPQLQAATGEAISAVSQKGQAQYQQSEANLENNAVMQELKRRGLFNQLSQQRQTLNRERIDAISEAADRAAELEPDTTTKDVMSQARESTKAYRAPLREFNDRIGKLESGAESLRKMADVVARGGEGKPPDPALAKKMLELANSYDKAANSQKYLREQLLKQEGTARTQTVYKALGKSIDEMAEQTQGAQRSLEGLQDQYQIDSPYSQFDQAMRGISHSFGDQQKEIEKTIETLEKDYTAAQKAAATAVKEGRMDESYYWTGYTKHLRANIDEQKRILEELGLTEDFARSQEQRKFERARDDKVFGVMERIGQFQQQVNPNADNQTDLNILGSYTTYEGLRRETQDEIDQLERIIAKKRASGKATDEETAALNYYKSVHKELHPIMQQAIANHEMLREALNAEEYLNVRVKLLEPILDLGQAAARNLKLRGNDFGAVELEKQVAIGQEDIRYKRQRVEIAKMRPELVQEFGIDEAQRKMDALYDTAERINQINLDSINKEFKGLAATIADTAKTALEGFLVDLTMGSKSIEDAFKDMAKSILQVIAQLAARQLILGLFGNGGVPAAPKQPSIAVDILQSFLGSGSSLASIFADGGEIKSHMALDAAQPTALGLAVMAGMSREGANAVPIVASIGEEVLSTRNSDAQFYRALKSQGAWEELKQGGVRNFALGGTVQSVHEPSPRYRAGQRVKQGDTTVTVIQNISTPDANSFRRSEGQIAQDSAYRTRRAYERNG